MIAECGSRNADLPEECSAGCTPGAHCGVVTAWFADRAVWLSPGDGVGACYRFRDSAIPQSAFRNPQFF